MRKVVVLLVILTTSYLFSCNKLGILCAGLKAFDQLAEYYIKIEKKPDSAEALLKEKISVIEKLFYTLKKKEVPHEILCATRRAYINSVVKLLGISSVVNKWKVEELFKQIEEYEKKDIINECPNKYLMYLDKASNLLPKESPFFKKLKEKEIEIFKTRTLKHLIEELE